jgi:lysozyme
MRAIRCLAVAFTLTSAACASGAETGVPGSDLSDGSDDGSSGGKADGDSAPRVCPGDGTVLGVDVSYYQGVIDWTAAKGAGVQFAFVRVSDGTRLSDPKFAANWSATSAAGIAHGAYQFFRPDEDPVAQADLLIAAVGSYKTGDLPPVIDVETTGGVDAATLAQGVDTWLTKVSNGLGVTPIIYTGPSFWRSNLESVDDAADPLWVAEYTSQCPQVAGAWTTWSFWQYSQTGQLAGFSGAVDLDRFNGTVEELNTFIAGQ